MDDELRRLVRRRGRIGALLTAVMVTTYFAFILLVAFDKETAGTLVGGRVSLGILLGAGLIVLAPILIAIYVRWANRVYDPAIEARRKS